MINAVSNGFNRKDALLYLQHIRKALIHIGIAIILASIGIYPLVPSVLSYLQGLAQADLAAFGIPETFITLLQLNLELAVLICMPFIFCKILAPIPKLFSSVSNRSIFVFWLSSVGLFFTGVLFCLKITLPYGMQFLLSFESPDLRPLISVKKFISFCALFLFGFGLIFQLPVVMVLVGRIFPIKFGQLARHRRYALLAVVVISAILTPTPDALNMLMMAVPLYLLFEIGLLGMRFFN